MKEMFYVAYFFLYQMFVYIIVVIKILDDKNLHSFE